jgi:CheY-like chemotaxis protein
MRILVTDDHPETCRIITAYLHEMGWQNTDAAHSGEEALLMLRAAAAANRHYELCLIDMIMPRMDGWRLGAEIINDQSINNSRLILMIPHGLLEAEAKMTLLKWFNAYINKPITRRALAKIIPLALEDTVEALEAEEEDGAPEAEAPGAENSAAGGPAAGKFAAGKPLILVAEDHPVNQKLFGVILEKLGYPSVLADDGQDALEKAAAHPVSLIFMDIQMPRMNGYEAAEELRKRGFNGPLVAVTASALADERERCKQAGFNDILLKPFRRPDIEGMLQKWDPAAEAPPAEGPAPAEGAAEKVYAAAPAGDPAIFDRREALESFLDNAEMVKSLLVRFLDRTGAALDAIDRCLREKNQDEGRREAHTIKGSALTLGGKELGAAAAALELAFKNAEFGEAGALAPPLADAFGRFKAEAESFINGGEP